MLLQIPSLLGADQTRLFREKLDRADWADGRITAGYQSAMAKHNLQLPEDHPLARELGDILLKVLPQNLLFMAAAVPFKIFPPLFNCYQAGQDFGKGYAAPGPHRPVHDGFSQRTAGIRGRRVDNRGHLRQQKHQIPGR
jgi:predicted 2-oxoglutarate/Fe(II)-dependent dioxygenase YbiX